MTGLWVWSDAVGCWMGDVCELIFVLAEGIEASSGAGGTEGVVLDCMGEGV